MPAIYHWDRSLSRFLKPSPLAIESLTPSCWQNIPHFVWYNSCKTEKNPLICEWENGYWTMFLLAAGNVVAWWNVLSVTLSRSRCTRHLHTKITPPRESVFYYSNDGCRNYYYEMKQMTCFVSKKLKKTFSQWFPFWVDVSVLSRTELFWLTTQFTQCCPTRYEWHTFF